jgi:ureidoglycolate hydrolase
MTANREQYRVPVEDVTPATFRPYGEIIEPRNALGQFIDKPYDPETSAEEAQLVLTNGRPRLWIMELNKIGVSFTKIARHRRVTQCLGSLEGKDWFIAVSAPGNSGDEARPQLEEIRGFRISGRCVIKLEIGTWHAGPLFQHDQCLFFNLENAETNKRDFHGVDLPVECRLAL